MNMWSLLSDVLSVCIDSASPAAAFKCDDPDTVKGCKQFPANNTDHVKRQKNIYIQKCMFLQVLRIFWIFGIRRYREVRFGEIKTPATSS